MLVHPPSCFTPTCESLAASMRCCEVSKGSSSGAIGDGETRASWSMITPAGAEGKPEARPERSMNGYTLLAWIEKWTAPSQERTSQTRWAKLLEWLGGKQASSRQFSVAGSRLFLASNVRPGSLDGPLPSCTLMVTALLEEVRSPPRTNTVRHSAAPTAAVVSLWVKPAEVREPAAHLHSKQLKHRGRNIGLQVSIGTQKLKQNRTE